MKRCEKKLRQHVRQRAGGGETGIDKLFPPLSCSVGGGGGGGVLRKCPGCGHSCEDPSGSLNGFCPPFPEREGQISDFSPVDLVGKFVRRARRVCGGEARGWEEEQAAEDGHLAWGFETIACPAHDTFRFPAPSTHEAEGDCLPPRHPLSWILSPPHFPTQARDGAAAARILGFHVAPAAAAAAAPPPPLPPVAAAAAGSSLGPAGRRRGVAAAAVGRCLLPA